MIKGYTIRKTATETIYVLEDATSGGTSAGSIASIAMPMGSVIKRSPTKKKTSKKVPTANLVVSESTYRWLDYNDIPDMMDRIRIFEAYHLHNANLFESNDTETAEYFSKLNSLSSKIKEGSRYIAVVLGLVNNQAIEMQPVELVTFLKQDNKLYTVQLSNDKIVTFPAATISNHALVNTFFFDSQATYDKFRSIISLKFGKLLTVYSEHDVDEGWGLAGAATAMSMKIVPGAGHNMPTDRVSEDDKDPCWNGYKKIGNKMKNEKSVPNCVKNESVDTYTARLQENLDSKLSKAQSQPTNTTPRNFVAKHAKTAGAGAHTDRSKTIPRHDKHKDNFRESEGSPEGVPHISKKLLQHIVQQIGTDGVQALVKSLKWGDGAAEELLALITQNLKKSAQTMKESDTQVQELDVSNTLKFTKKAHKSQMYGDKPYWTHPKSVATTGKKFFGNKFGPDAIKVALLHDVVEDTPYKLQQLSKMGYSPTVIQAVQLLTKNKELSYEDNIKAIINSGNRLAMMVKYADNYQNFTGDKSSWAVDKAAQSQKKYLASLNMLGAKLGINQHLGDNPDVQGASQDSTDAYKEGLDNMLRTALAEKIRSDAPVGAWIQDFEKADPNKYHQFKNKTADKKRRMAIAAYYASKQKIKENTVILEGRDAPLYHFTRISGFRKIIETDSLIASGRGKIYFTRDYRRQFVPGEAAREGEGIGFRIDQSKLARTFGNKLQAGGQNTVRGTNYDRILSPQDRQEWLDDPRNVWTIKQHEKNPTGQSMSRTNGNNAADIIRGTTAQGARWESEEWLMTTALPNFHTYVTGLVIQEAGGAKGRTKPSEDILTELANYFIKQYAGRTGFETRNLLIDYAIKMKIPFVYRQRDIDSTQLKKRIIQIFSDRKNSRM